MDRKRPLLLHQPAQLHVRRNMCEAGEADEASADCYMCPIAVKQLLVEAAVTAEGQVYDPDSILEWLQENTTDPLTRKELWTTRVVLADPVALPAIVHHVRKEGLFCYYVMSFRCVPRPSRRALLAALERVHDHVMMASGRLPDIAVDALRHNLVPRIVDDDPVMATLACRIAARAAHYLYAEYRRDVTFMAVAVLDTLGRLDGLKSDLCASCVLSFVLVGLMHVVERVLADVCIPTMLTIMSTELSAKERKSALVFLLESRVWCFSVLQCHPEQVMQFFTTHFEKPVFGQLLVSAVMTHMCVTERMEDCCLVTFCKLLVEFGPHGSWHLYSLWNWQGVLKALHAKGVKWTMKQLPAAFLQDAVVCAASSSSRESQQYLRPLCDFAMRLLRKRKWTFSQASVLVLRDLMHSMPVVPEECEDFLDLVVYVGEQCRGWPYLPSWQLLESVCECVVKKIVEPGVSLIGSRIEDIANLAVVALLVPWPVKAHLHALLLWTFVQVPVYTFFPRKECLERLLSAWTINGQYDDLMPLARNAMAV